MDKKQVKKIIKTVGNIFFIITFLFIFVTAIFSVLAKISGQTPSFAGYQIYNVLGGSMEPAIKKGSVVVLKQVNPESLLIDDVITFKNINDSNELITHRIVSINNENGLSFITRGDANDVNDSLPVIADDIVGKTNFSIPIIGYLFNFIQSKLGLVTLIIIPGVLIIILEALNLFKYISQQRKTKVAN